MPPPNRCYPVKPMTAMKPGLVDLLAMGRTMPRAEIRGTELGKRIRSANEKAKRRIKNAVAQLVDLDIGEAEIRALVEARIVARLKEC